MNGLTEEFKAVVNYSRLTMDANRWYRAAAEKGKNNEILFQRGVFYDKLAFKAAGKHLVKAQAYYNSVVTKSPEFKAIYRQSSAKG